jgi:hypothetical protein
MNFFKNSNFKMDFKPEAMSQMPVQQSTMQPQQGMSPMQLQQNAPHMDDEIPEFVLQSIEEMISMMPVNTIADMMRAFLRFLRGRYIKNSDPRFAQLDEAMKKVDSQSSIEDCKNVTIMFEQYFAAPSDPKLDDIIRFLLSIRKETEIEESTSTEQVQDKIETTSSECDCEDSFEILQIQTMIMQMQTMIRLLEKKEGKIRQCCMNKCKYCGK